MGAFNVNVFEKITSIDSGKRASSLGAKLYFDFFLPSGVEAHVECTYCRFAAAVGGAGIPLARMYDATYLHYCVTGTWAAGIAYAFGGISLIGGYVAGDYGWVQTGGLNIVAVAGAAAISAGAKVCHNEAGTSVKEASTDALRVKYFGILDNALGGAGNIPIGQLCLARVW